MSNSRTAVAVEIQLTGEVSTRAWDGEMGAVIAEWTIPVSA